MPRNDHAKLIRIYFSSGYREWTDPHLHNCWTARNPIEVMTYIEIKHLHREESKHLENDYMYYLFIHFLETKDCHYVTMTCSLLLEAKYALCIYLAVYVPIIIIWVRWLKKSRKTEPRNLVTVMEQQVQE